MLPGVFIALSLAHFFTLGPGAFARNVSADLSVPRFAWHAVLRTFRRGLDGGCFSSAGFSVTGRLRLHGLAIDRVLSFAVDPATENVNDAAEVLHEFLLRGMLV